MALTLRVLRWSYLLLGLLLVWQLVTMRPGTRALWRLALANAAQGNIGVGIPGSNAADFTTAKLEPGDIILGHNPATSWGYWTHASLYVGDGLVVETLLRRGVHLQPVTRFTYAYQGAAILRPKAPPTVKARAVAIARAQLGKPYNLLSGRDVDRWFYCVRLAWYAYQQAGLDLDPAGGFWVTPDNLAAYPQAALILDPR